MSPVCQIPVEILYIVFSKLPINQLSPVMRVCSRWNAIVDDPLFWKQKAVDLAGNDLNYRMRFDKINSLSLVDWKKEVREYGCIVYRVRQLFHLAVLHEHAGDMIMKHRDLCYEFQKSLKKKMYEKMLAIDRKLESLLERPFLSNPDDLKYLFGKIETAIDRSIVVFKAMGRAEIVDIAVMFPKKDGHVGLYCSDVKRVCIQRVRHGKNNELNPCALRILQKIKAGETFYVQKKGYLKPI